MNAKQRRTAKRASPWAWGRSLLAPAGPRRDGGAKTGYPSTLYGIECSRDPVRLSGVYVANSSEPPDWSRLFANLLRMGA